MEEAEEVDDFRAAAPVTTAYAHALWHAMLVTARYHTVGMLSLDEAIELEEALPATLVLGRGTCPMRFATQRELAAFVRTAVPGLQFSPQCAARDLRKLRAAGGLRDADALEMPTDYTAVVNMLGQIDAACRAYA